MQKTLLVLMGAVILLAVATGGSWAQATTITVQYNDTPLAQVLACLQRVDPGLQYAVSPELADTKVTATLVDLTAQQALQVVMAQCGLVAVAENGVYQIRRLDKPVITQAPRATARPTLPAFVPNPAETVAAASPKSATPTATAGASAASSSAPANKPPLRLIQLQYADPADLAWLFGGNVVEGGGLYAGGSNGGGYGGGNSNNGWGGNNSGNGNSNNGWGGGTNRGSSRLGSSRSGYNNNYSY